MEENIDFDNFLKEMGVTDDATIQKMIQATKQVTKLRYFLISISMISPKVTLTANSDGTWTQVSGLKTSTFPINEEFKVCRQVIYFQKYVSLGFMGRERIDRVCHNGWNTNDKSIQGIYNP